MSWKKFFCGAMAASIIFSASTFCSAAEESATAKLTRIEIDTYGEEQSGALLERIAALEKSYNGENAEGNMNARIETIYDALYDNSAEPAILAKINALEWNVNHEVASGGIDERLSVLENQIFGAATEGSFNERIRALAKASFGDETLPIEQVQIPANTLIKVETTEPVGSKIMQKGDTIPIRVMEDVFVKGKLVFAKGLPGEGVVTDVRRAKNIFSNGKIDIDFSHLKTIDGQTAAICTDTEAQDEMNAHEMARGLSLIGQSFSGKGLSEVFSAGKNIDLPAGIELYVQIKMPLVVYGVVTGDEPESTPAVEQTPEPTAPPVEPTPEPTTPPPVEPTPETTPPAEETPVKTAPPAEAEPLPSAEKTLDEFDGEVIEIIDDE